MLRSMTGFGAGDAETESYRFHIEVKAVNQRYLDIDVRMPYVLNRFDDVIKKKINPKNNFWIYFFTVSALQKIIKFSMVITRHLS